MNKVILVGNLGMDPELRYTANGTPVASFSLATNKVWLDQKGEKQQETQWHRIVVWSKQAENVTKYLKKGSKCLVEGEIRNTKWTDDKGVERYGTDIVAQQIQFLEGGQGGSRAPHPADTHEEPPHQQSRGQARDQSGQGAQGNGTNAAISQMRTESRSEPFGSESDIPF